MPEKTKPEEDACQEEKTESEKTCAETEEVDKAAWSRHQQEKSYYYDDAHGYEIYNPDEDDED